MQISLTTRLGSRYFEERYCWETAFHHPKEMLWCDMEDWLKELAVLQTEEWTDELKSHEYLMYERNEGGGLFGVSPNHSRILESLIVEGKSIMLARKEQERVERMSRRVEYQRA